MGEKSHKGDFALTRKRRSKRNLAVSSKRTKFGEVARTVYPSCVSLSSLSLTGSPRPLFEGARRGTHFLCREIALQVICVEALASMKGTY